MSDNLELSVTNHNMIDYSDEAYIEELSDIPEPSVTGPDHNLIYWSEGAVVIWRICLTT